MLNEVLKICEKCYLLDVKATKVTRNKRSGGLSDKFLSLKYNVKGTYIFI